MIRHPGRLLVIVLLSVFFLVFLGLPLFTVLREGMNPAIIAEVFRHPIYREGLVNAFCIAVVTTTLVFLIAVPLAVLYDRCEFPGRRYVNALIMVPMILPPFVGALGFQQIFGKFGAFNALLSGIGMFAAGNGPDWLGGGGRFWAVCVVEALHLYPILYLNATTALANVDPTLDEAARNLGADRWTRFRRITLPLIRPGLFAGGSIVLIWSFTELGTPLMLGFDRVVTVQIFSGVSELESNPLPYALVLILLTISAGLYALSRWLFGRGGAAAGSKGMTGSHSHPTGRIGGLLVLGAFLALTVVAALPHIGVILLSIAGDWYRTVVPDSYTMQHFANALGHPFVVPSIINSLFYSSLAMITAVAAGLCVALLTVRWRPRGWQIFDTVSMLPLAIPGIILAFGYLSMATRYDLLRTLLDPVRNPTILLVIAYAMRRLPYVSRAATAGLQQTPESLEEAARNLGAGSWTTLRRIVVPLVAANLVVGALFAFSFSMLEVSDSLILAQKEAFYPITRAIFELSQVLGQGPYLACAFGVWAMAFLAGTLIAANVILGKKMGALFRF